MSEVTPYTPPTELRPTVHFTTTSKGQRSYNVIVGRRRMTYTYEPRCHVCKHPDQGVRTEIHELAANGVPVRRILETIGPEAGISERSLRSHLNSHVPDYSIFERAVRAAGVAVGDGDVKRITGVMASQVILERGLMALVNDEMRLDASDILAAAKFQHDTEIADRVIDTRLYEDLTLAILNRFMQMIGMARFNEVMWSLSTDPKIGEIMAAIGVTTEAIVEAREHDPVQALISTM